MMTEILSNDVVLFFITVIACVAVLFYTEQIVEENEGFTWGKKIFCGLMNGFFILGVMMLEGILRTLLLMVGAPVIMCVELMIYTRDNLVSYAVVYLKLAMNFMSIFWITFALVSMGMEAVGHEKEIMAITLMGVGGMAAFLGSSKKYPMKELKLMIHDLKAGKPFVVYLGLGDIFLLTSSFILTPFLQSVMVEGPVMTLLSLELLLKTLIILGFSYMILYLRAKEIKTEYEIQEMRSNLESEKSFRSTVQRKGMLNVQVNITTNSLKDGGQYFQDTSWLKAGSYEGAIRWIAKRIVHPKDRDAFVKVNRMDTIQSLLETAPYYSHQIRVSPREMMKIFRLEKSFRDRYEQTEKNWMWIKLDYIYTKDITTGDISLFMVVFDVDEQVALKEQLHLSATTDPLTGLLNRTITQYEIETKLKETKNQGVMFLMDIDNFKGINDRLGHPVGDEVLIRFSHILRRIFRKNDVVGRLGGDEFSVFIPGELPRSLIEEMGKRINERTGFVYETQGGEKLCTSASIGIAIAQRQDTYETLYKKADLALYESKERGKGTYTFYENDEI